MKRPKTKPVYAWVAVWVLSSGRKSEIDAGKWIAWTRAHLLSLIREESAMPHCWRPVRVELRRVKKASLAARERKA